MPVKGLRHPGISDMQFGDHQYHTTKPMYIHNYKGSDVVEVTAIGCVNSNFYNLITHIQPITPTATCIILLVHGF